MKNVKFLLNGVFFIFLISIFAQKVEAQYFIDFEGPGETKTGYASGTVNLSGLDWNMTEALIGTLDAVTIMKVLLAKFHPLFQNHIVTIVGSLYARAIINFIKMMVVACTNIVFSKLPIASTIRNRFHLNKISYHFR